MIVETTWNDVGNAFCSVYKWASIAGVGILITCVLVAVVSIALKRK